jgi:hypothetical protein
MSERTYAPRSGGRAAEPRGRAGDAGQADTRRSGMRREQETAAPDAVRGTDRTSRTQRTEGRSVAAERRGAAAPARGRTTGTDATGRGAGSASAAEATRGREPGESRLYREAGLGRGARAERDGGRTEREGSGRGAGLDRAARAERAESGRGAGLDRASRTARAERVGRSDRLERAERLNRADRLSRAEQGRGERPGRIDRSVRAEGAPGPRAALRNRRAELAGTRSGLGSAAGADAPVDGTAALKVDAEPVRFEAEPARVIDLDRPRLQVAPPAPISVPRAPFVAGVLGVVVVGVLGILLINTKTNENSFRIADLQKQESTLDSQQQDLDNQLAIVSSPGSLDAAARRLGLVKAQPAVIRLPDGKIIGMLRPADGKTSVTAQNAPGDGDKGAANIVPDGSASGRPGLTPNGTNGQAANGQAANGQTGTGQTGTGTGGTGTGGTGTGGTGTGGTGTGGTGTGGTGTAANGTAANGTVNNGAAGNATVDGTGR